MLEELLADRGALYGDFYAGAAIMQELKQVVRSTPGWNNLAPDMREALDLIMSKAGRILNGRPDYADNWLDIAGYA